MLARLIMVGTLFSGVHRRVDHWCSVTTGLADTVGSLPGLEEISPTSWIGVVVAV